MQINIPQWFIAPTLAFHFVSQNVALGIKVKLSILRVIEFFFQCNPSCGETNDAILKVAMLDALLGADADQPNPEIGVRDRSDKIPRHHIAPSTLQEAQRLTPPIRADQIKPPRTA